MYPPVKQTWHWKFTFSNRKYIFKWWMFHCYRRVSNACCGGWHPQRPSVGCFNILKTSDSAMAPWRGRGRLGEVVDLFFHGENPHYPCRFHLIIHGRFHVGWLFTYMNNEKWPYSSGNGLVNIPMPWSILGKGISGYTQQKLGVNLPGKIRPY